MPKLHLVGITPDHRGLVLSEHARSKHGDMVLEIDDRLLEAIDKAHRLRTLDEGHGLESAALPTKRVAVNGDGAAPPRLSPREIQQRLRAGESITALARSSGTDEAWIRRFATPVLAEQAKVVERARALTVTKRGVGPSGATLGPAVAANVIDRGVPLTIPDLEAGWSAFQGPEGGWHVTFTFPLRGRRQTAEWELDLTTGDLTPRNKLASDLGWREPGKKLPQPAPARVAAAPKRVSTSRVAPAAPPADAPAGEGKATTESGAPAGGENATTRPGAAEGEAKASVRPGAAEGQETVQVLPLEEAEKGSLPSGGPAGQAPSARRAPVKKAPVKKAPVKKAPVKKAPVSKAPARKPAPPAKRAAAALTEAAAQTVVPVLSAEPEAGSSRPPGSMPPTDLDVVDVLGQFPPIDDDDAVRESVIVIPPSAEDEVGAAEPGAPAPTEPEEFDAPTGPISLRARPQPAPLGAPPAPRGGPPAP